MPADIPRLPISEEPWHGQGRPPWRDAQKPGSIWSSMLPDRELFSDEPEWLWPGKLPQGEVTMMVGDETPGHLTWPYIEPDVDLEPYIDMQARYGQRIVCQNRFEIGGAGYLTGGKSYFTTNALYHEWMARSWKRRAWFRITSPVIMLGFFIAEKTRRIYRFIRSK